jgi:superfamily II DNA or RNA helicase
MKETIEEINKRRTEMQIKILNLWVKRNYKGTAQLATGIGKSALGVFASKHYVLVKKLKDFKILIIAPSETIRDIVWKDDFKKFKATRAYNNNVTIECIQTIYKWRDTHWDLIIADEIHHYIGNEKYENFFKLNTWDKILGLSATISKDKVFYLNKYAPIFVTIGTKLATKMGFVSTHKVYNLGVELTVNERLYYDKYTEIFNDTFDLFNRDLKLLFVLLDKDKFKDYLASKSLEFDEYKTYPYECIRAMKKRKEIMNKAYNKLNIANSITEMFKRKTIIFSSDIEMAKKIQETIGSKRCVEYHSKISKKNRDKAFKWYNDGRTTVDIISTVKALNEGITIKNISLGIQVSGNSTKKDFVQRLGRQIRLDNVEEPIFIILYSINTKEEDWVKSSQNNSDDYIWINNINEIKNT